MDKAGKGILISPWRERATTIDERCTHQMQRHYLESEGFLLVPEQLASDQTDLCGDQAISLRALHGQWKRTNLQNVRASDILQSRQVDAQRQAVFQSEILWQSPRPKLHLQERYSSLEQY